MFRYVRYCWLPFVLVSAVTLFGCKPKGEGKNTPADEGAATALEGTGTQQNPLAAITVKTTDEKPLLLLDEPPTQELPPPEGPVADNSRCHVCHMNYAEEELAVLHARANIGCEQCHGPSDAHCGDEDNVTPPDIMYPLEKINPSCMACHPKESIDIQEHEPFFDGTAPDKKYCTDCHGNHRLNYRTRRWDKSTGELVEDDNVRMTTESVLQ